MLFDLLGWAMLDGLAAVMNSPFIIPVAGCVMILGMSASSMWAKVRSEEIKSHERLARIAQGLPVETPTNWDEATLKAATEGQGPAPRVVSRGTQRPNDGGGARRAGFVLVSVGVGLIAFFFSLAVIVRVREVMSGGAAGLIPLAIGVGFLIDARLKRKDFERYLEWERAGLMGSAGAGAALSAGIGSSVSTPPPPPPVGMTAAQASDWRPLH